MERDLIVAATGFAKDGNIIIDIQARLKGNDDREVSRVKNRVVEKIAFTLNKIYKEASDEEKNDQGKSVKAV